MIQPKFSAHCLESIEALELRDMIRINESDACEYEFYKITDPHDLFYSLKLVQDVYIQEGYLDPQKVSGPCRILKHHHFEDTAVFAGKKDDEIVFTVSLFPDSHRDLPMDTIYNDELEQLRDSGRSIGEVGCLATHPAHRTGTQIIPMYCNKIILNYAMEQLELDDLVITVHPRHAQVYKEILLFEELTPGTVKPYPNVNNNPAVALRLDLRDIKNKYRQCYCNKPLEADLHHFVFVRDCPNIDINSSASSPACGYKAILSHPELLVG